MKKLFLIIFIFFLTINCFPQKLSIGIENNLFYKYDFSISILPNPHLLDNVKPMKLVLYPLDLNLVFNCAFDNNVFLKTAFGFYNYNSAITFKKYTLKNRYDAIYNLPYDYKSFTIPILVGYKQKISSRFFVKYSAGLSFDFIFYCIYSPPWFPEDSDPIVYQEYLQGKEEYFQKYNILFDFYSSEKNYKTKFNVLLSQQITFTYETKKNFYIDIFAGYNAGLIKTIDADGSIKYKKDNSTYYYKSAVVSNGSYWHIGLGFGYIFKGKKKN